MKVIQLPIIWVLGNSQFDCNASISRNIINHVMPPSSFNIWHVNLTNTIIIIIMLWLLFIITNYDA